MSLFVWRASSRALASPSRRRPVVGPSLAGPYQAPGSALLGETTRAPNYPQSRGADRACSSSLPPRCGLVRSYLSCPGSCRRTLELPVQPLTESRHVSVERGKTDVCLAGLESGHSRLRRTHSCCHLGLGDAAFCTAW